MDKKPSTILRAGADILRERGLARGVYEDNRGRVCVLGACIVAAIDRDRSVPHVSDVVTQVYPFVRRAVPKGWNVTRYNDAEGRTAEEVVQVMLAAAELAEKEGR